MPDILLDNLLPILPKLDAPSRPSGSRGLPDGGSSFESHLGQERSRRSDAASSSDDRPARSTSQRPADRPSERTTTAHHRPSDDRRADPPAVEDDSTDTAPAASSQPSDDSDPQPVTDGAANDKPDQEPHEDKAVDTSAAEAAAAGALQPAKLLAEAAIPREAVVESVVAVEPVPAPEAETKPDPSTKEKLATPTPVQPTAPTSTAVEVPVLAPSETATFSAEEAPVVEVQPEAAKKTVEQPVAPQEVPATVAQPASVTQPATTAIAAAAPIVSGAVQAIAEGEGNREELARQDSPSDGSPVSKLLTSDPAAVSAANGSPATAATAASTISPAAPGDAAANTVVAAPLDLPPAVIPGVSAERSATQAEPGKASTEFQQRLAGIEQREFAPRLGPLQTNTEAQPHGLSQYERVQLAQRVASAMQLAGDNGGVLRLRLSPPELGSLNMEVAVRDGVMHARIEAETPQAQAVLLENLPSLRERLAEQDLRLGRFDVDLPNRQPSEGWSRQFQGDRRQPDGYGSAREPQQRSTDAARATPTARAVREGGLDVTV